MENEDYKQKLNRNINLHYIVTFLSHLIFFIPIWVAFERQYLTFTQMSLIASFRFGLTAILEMPTGALADLLGRKITVVSGFFAEMIGMLIMAFATGGNSIWIAAVFRGSGDALRSGADSSLIYDSLKENNKEKSFGEVNANIGIIVQLAITTSSILAGYMFVIWVGLPYLAYAIALLVCTFISLFLMSEPKVDSEKFTLRNYINQNKIGIKETFKSFDQLLFSLFYMLVGGITWSMTIFMNQIFASSIGYDEIGKSWLFGAIRFINGILIIKILKLHKYLSKKYAFLFFAIGLTLVTLPSLYVDQIVGTLFLFVITLISTLRHIVLDQFAHDEFQSKYRATSMSVLNLYISIMYVMIVGISGIVTDTYSIELYYSIIGILSLLMIIPLAIVLTKRLKFIS